MRYENRLTGWQADDKSLMAAALIVVREHFYDNSLCFNLNVAGLILERCGQYGLGLDWHGPSNVR